MSRAFGATPSTYAEADRILGKRESLIIARNTRLERARWTPGTIGVRLHATVIVRFHEDGRVVLNTGGRWNTLTTRERMNRYLPPRWGVGTDRGVLWLYHAENDVTSARYVWEDGLEIHDDVTTARRKDKRPYRPRAAHRAECRCVCCAYPRRWERAHTVTPEATVWAQPAGVSADRWATYNRRFCDLLHRGAVPA